MFAIGRNPTIEALKSQHKVSILYIEDKDQNQHNYKQGQRDEDKVDQAVSLARKRGIRVEPIGRKRMEKMAGGHPHQGVIADVDFETAPLLAQAERDQFYIYIREAQDDHNVGAIIRSAEAAGLAGVILQPKQKLTDTLARTSMGAIFHIPIIQYSLFPAIKTLRKAGFLISAIEINGAKNIYESTLDSPGMLIVGGEDHSISPEVAKECDQLVFIPQFGKVNSLNMGVAAAVAMYEHVRQTAE